MGKKQDCKGNEHEANEVFECYNCNTKYCTTCALWQNLVNHWYDDEEEDVEVLCPNCGENNF